MPVRRSPKGRPPPCSPGTRPPGCGPPVVSLPAPSSGIISANRVEGRGTQPVGRVHRAFTGTKRRRHRSLGEWCVDAVPPSSPRSAGGSFARRRGRPVGRGAPGTELPHTNRSGTATEERLAVPSRVHLDRRDRAVTAPAEQDQRSSRTERSPASGASTARAPTRRSATTPTASSCRSSSCPDPLRGPADRLVMCEVLLTDFTPHPTNTRSKLREVVEQYESFEPLFGIEQEYTFFKDGRPLGWPAVGLPGAPGPLLLRRRRRQDARARDRRAPHRGLHRRGPLDRGHQRRGDDGAVGVPDRGAPSDRALRPALGGAVAALPDRRGLRRLGDARAEADPRRLERRGGPHQLLDQGDARGGRSGR